MAVCQAGGPARCPQASEASQCQEHPCWVQGAGDTTHPGGLTALSGGPQSMGQPLPLHPCEVGWVWLSLGSSRGQDGCTGWVSRGQGPLPAIPYSPTSCPHPYPSPTLLLASQSISQLLEGSHCQPKAGQRDTLAGWSPPRAVLLARRDSRVVSPEAGDRYPEEQAGTMSQQCPPASRAPSLCCAHPCSRAVPVPRTYPAGAQLVTVCPVARQHFELLSPGLQVQFHPHHWGRGETG